MGHFVSLLVISTVLLALLAGSARGQAPPPVTTPTAAAPVTTPTAAAPVTTPTAAAPAVPPVAVAKAKTKAAKPAKIVKAVIATGATKAKAVAPPTPAVPPVAVAKTNAAKPAKATETSRTATGSTKAKTAKPAKATETSRTATGATKAKASKAEAEHLEPVQWRRPVVYGSASPSVDRGSAVALPRPATGPLLESAVPVTRTAAPVAPAVVSQGVARRWVAASSPLASAALWPPRPALAATTRDVSSPLLLQAAAPSLATDGAARSLAAVPRRASAEAPDRTAVSLPAAPPRAPEAPAAGSGGAASAGSGAAGGAFFVAVLCGVLLLAARRWGRVLVAPAIWRPTVFLTLPERPG